MHARNKTFCSDVQHTNAEQPQVKSLRLQQCREITPLTDKPTVLLMRSCIHMLQEQSIAEGAEAESVWYGD